MLYNTSSNPDALLSILGVACDFGSFGVEGCQHAPAVIEQLSKFSGTGKLIKDIATGETLVDLSLVEGLGTLKYQADQRVSNFLEGLQVISEKVSQKRTLLSVGGDHLISYPLIKGVLQNTKKLQVLQFDAHFDCNPISEKTTVSHNNFVNYLCGEESGISNWVMVGQRGVGKGAGELPPVCQRSGRENILKYLDKSVPVYISIDLDVLDLKEFQAVSFPGTGEGLKFEELLSSISQLIDEGHEIVGIDICEYNPKLDTPSKLYGRVLVDFVSRVISLLLKQNLKVEL